jgi:plasmid maintenance system antidote protein VapI
MTMHNPAHLDDILKGLVTDSLKLTITDVALHLDISQKILSKVLNAR